MNAEPLNIGRDLATGLRAFFDAQCRKLLKLAAEYEDAGAQNAAGALRAMAAENAIQYERFDPNPKPGPRITFADPVDAAKSIVKETARATGSPVDAGVARFASEVFEVSEQDEVDGAVRVCPCGKHYVGATCPEGRS